MDTPSTAQPPVASAEDKTVAIVSYLTLIGFIVGIVMHSNKKTQLGAYHLRQMLGLVIFSIGVIIPLLGLIWSLFLLVLWVMGFISAVQGQQKPVPVFGAMFQKWFAGAFN